MNIAFRLSKRLLPSAKPTLEFTRGCVAEKCVPKVPRAAKKMKKLQAHYQDEENKAPIFLKGGVKDQILYRLTVLLSLGSIVWQGYTYYQMSQPG